MQREDLKPLLVELRAGLEGLYPGRLRGVYLFGSYARAEEDAESDLDVLVVLDRVPRYAEEIERTSQLVSALSLRHSVCISRMFVDQATWSRRGDPFLENVRSEAVAA
jgi:predicted nucleotidyltransferase